MNSDHAQLDQAARDLVRATLPFPLPEDFPGSLANHAAEMLKRICILEWLQIEGNYPWVGETAFKGWQDSVLTAWYRWTDPEFYGREISEERDPNGYTPVHILVSGLSQDDFELAPWPILIGLLACASDEISEMSWDQSNERHSDAVSELTRRISPHEHFNNNRWSITKLWRAHSAAKVAQGGPDLDGFTLFERLGPSMDADLCSQVFSSSSLTGKQGPKQFNPARYGFHALEQARAAAGEVNGRIWCSRPELSHHEKLGHHSIDFSQTYLGKGFTDYIIECIKTALDAPTTSHSEHLALNMTSVLEWAAQQAPESAPHYTADLEPLERIYAQLKPLAHKYGGLDLVVIGELIHKATASQFEWPSESSPVPQL